MNNSNSQHLDRRSLAEALGPCLSQECAEERHFNPGETIFKEGERVVGCYVIQTGSVELSLASKRHRIAVEMVGPGEVVGLSGVFAERKYALTATAVTETTARYLPCAAIKGCAQQDPALSALILSSLGKSVQQVFRSSAEARARAQRRRRGRVVSQRVCAR